MRRVVMFCDTYLFRGVSALCTMLLVVMLLSVGLQVVMRYVFNAPLVWSEELARFTMVWLALLASAVAMRRGQHIAMTGLLPIPKRIAPLARAVMVVACIAILATLVYYGFELAQRTMSQRSSGLGLPMGYMYAAIPVCAFLMIVGQLMAWLTATGENDKGADKGDP